MKSPFKLVRGVQLGDLSGVHEGYSFQQTPDGSPLALVNVSAERISSTFANLLEAVTYPAYFVIEIGSDEGKSSGQPVSSSHDIYYLDGLSLPDTKKLFLKYEQLFVQDGSVNFGVGAHDSRDEVFVAAYKLFHIYADDPKKYETRLNQLGFHRESALKTAWDMVSSSSPGKRHRLHDLAIGIDQLMSELTPAGLYLAEQR